MMIAAKLLKIAFMNVFRNRRRTLLTLGVLVVGGAGMIVMGGFFDNLMLSLREKIIHGQSGHLQVALKNYYRLGVAGPLDYLMKDADEVRTIIENTPHVLYAVPRVTFSGMASTDKTSLAVSVTGSDPVLENRMGSVKASNAKIPSIAIREGRELDPNKKDEVLVGLGLMQALDLKVGAWVMVLTTREQGALDGNRFHTVGVFETAVREADNRSMKINLTAAQDMLGAAGRLHSFQVLLDETENTETVRQELIRSFGGDKGAYEVLTWEEMAAYYRQSRSLFQKIMTVIALIFGIVFFFSAGNTVNMSLMERVREFGTMMAIGNGRPVILLVILMETLLIGVLGGSLSVLAGIGLGELITSIGIEMPPTPNSTTGYLAVITITPLLIVKAFGLTVISSFLASLIPAYRATRMPIVEALTHV